MGIFVDMDTYCTIQIDAIFCILLVHFTFVAIWGQSVQIWQFKTKLDKIVNFIDFAYKNDIKYIILHDPE